MALQNRQCRFVDDVTAAFVQVESLHHQRTAWVLYQENARIIAEYEPPSLLVCEIGLRDERNNFAAICAFSNLELLLPANQWDKLFDGNFTWPGKRPRDADESRCGHAIRDKYQDTSKIVHRYPFSLHDQARSEEHGGG